LKQKKCPYNPKNRGKKKSGNRNSEKIFQILIKSLRKSNQIFSFVLGRLI